MTQKELLPEEDYDLSMEEMHYYSVVTDISELIDNNSLFNVLLDISRYVENPQEQHLVAQLIKLLENYEKVLLSMTPANVLLEPADRYRHVSELKGVSKRKQWWEE